MGCWCETCGVTQLPINAGDKVRHFVLVNDGCYRFADGGGAGGGTCYSTDIWSPMGPAIEGTYDDYGGIENIVENDDTRMLVEVLRDGWQNFKHESWEEKLTPITTMNLLEMLHWIERDKASLSPIHPGRTRWLGQMMVHEAVYQSMINYDFIDAHHYKQGHYRYRPYSEIMVANLKEWYENALGLYKDLGGVEDYKKEIRIESLIDMTDYFWGRHSESGWRGIRQYRTKLVEFAKEQIPFEDKRVQKLCLPVLELIRFSRAMSDARKMWHPQSGKGGQHNELFVYNRINEAIQKVMSEREEEQRKWAEEDGEEYEPRDPMAYSSYMIEHNEKDAASTDDQE